MPRVYSTAAFTYAVRTARAEPALPPTAGPSGAGADRAPPTTAAADLGPDPARTPADHEASALADLPRLSDGALAFALACLLARAAGAGDAALSRAAQSATRAGARVAPAGPDAAGDAPP